MKKKKIMNRGRMLFKRYLYNFYIHDGYLKTVLVLVIRILEPKDEEDVCSPKQGSCRSFVVLSQQAHAYHDKRSFSLAALILTSCDKQIPSSVSHLLTSRDKRALHHLPFLWLVATSA